MANGNQNDWHTLRPAPRPVPDEWKDDIKWDVFLSYRSINRAWVLALYDVLVEAGFDVFLDQYVLVPGDSLRNSLQKNLKASGAGILIWSEDSDSDWVEREHNAMGVLADRRKNDPLPFETVVANLDGSELPLLQADSLYVDFTAYPEGPRGGELLRLMYGVIGAPLSPEAVRAIEALDAETKDVMSALEAARNEGFPEDIVSAAQTGGKAWTATAMLASLAAEYLNSLGKYDEVLTVIDLYKDQFEKSIRLQHMQALAYRRTDRYKDALKVLSKLYAAEHRDPETLGLYGASLAKRYDESGDRAHLEKSQQVYADAFAGDPHDFYTGINAASKAALLGHDSDVYRPIAEQVAALPAIQDPDVSDYWALATAGEAKLLALDVNGAVDAYAEAVRRHAEQKGSISSTRDQLVKLLEVMDLAEEDKERLLRSLGG